MLDRLVHLAPALRVTLIAVSVLGLLGLGVVFAAGGLRGEAARAKEGAATDPVAAGRAAAIPPMDREAPERIETATFAMG